MGLDNSMCSVAVEASPEKKEKEGIEIINHTWNERVPTPPQLTQMLSLKVNNTAHDAIEQILCDGLGDVDRLIVEEATFLAAPCSVTSAAEERQANVGLLQRQIVCTELQTLAIHTEASAHLGATCAQREVTLGAIDQIITILDILILAAHMTTAIGFLNAGRDLCPVAGQTTHLQAKACAGLLGVFRRREQMLAGFHLVRAQLNVILARLRGDDSLHAT